MSDQQTHDDQQKDAETADRVQHVVICPDHSLGKGLVAGLIETLDAEFVVAEVDRELPTMEIHAIQAPAPVDICPVIEDKTPYYRRFEKRYR